MYGASQNTWIAKQTATEYFRTVACQHLEIAQRISRDHIKGTVARDFWACFLACMDASRPEYEPLLPLKLL
jgi:hypothetical protein